MLRPMHFSSRCVHWVEDGGYSGRGWRVCGGTLGFPLFLLGCWVCTLGGGWRIWCVHWVEGMVCTLGRGYGVYTGWRVWCVHWVEGMVCTLGGGYGVYTG